MKTAILASVVASAAAFAPVSKVVTKTSLAASPYEAELGVIKPTGFFDPLGLSSNIDPDTFAQYRAAELKHGRVAQLAVLGYIVPEVYRFDFDIAPGLPCSEVPNGVAALDAIPSLGWAQIVFFIGAVDYWGVLGDFEVGKKAAASLSPDKLEERQLQELQHGRLAMLAILELLRHDSQNLVQPGFDGLDKMISGLPFLYE
jgi:hypothetical protein